MAGTIRDERLMSANVSEESERVADGARTKVERLVPSAEERTSYTFAIEDGDERS